MPRGLFIYLSILSIYLSVQINLSVTYLRNMPVSVVLCFKVWTHLKIPCWDAFKVKLVYGCVLSITVIAQLPYCNWKQLCFHINNKVVRLLFFLVENSSKLFQLFHSFSLQCSVSFILPFFTRVAFPGDASIPDGPIGCELSPTYHKSSVARPDGACSQLPLPTRAYHGIMLIHDSLGMGALQHLSSAITRFYMPLGFHEPTASC